MHSIDDIRSTALLNAILTNGRPFIFIYFTDAFILRKHTFSAISSVLPTLIQRNATPPPEGHIHYCHAIIANYAASYISQSH
jgi:hypothetical protein